LFQFLHFVLLISSTVQADHENSLMHYTKLIIEEHFSAGRPQVVVLFLAEEDSTNYEVEHLIEALNKSVHWPVLVYNVADEIGVIVHINTHEG